MTVRYATDEAKKTVTAQIVGGVTLPEVRRYLDEPVRVDLDGYNLVVDMSEAKIELSSRDVMKAVTLVGTLIKGLHVGKYAVIAPDDLTFGTCRMAEQWIAAEWLVYVAHNATDAFSWLLG